MNCNVLIVDDSPILRTAIKKVVKLAGVADERIHEAGNGKEALEILETIWVDLVLLDLNMPVMDGETFAQTLKDTGKHQGTPIIVVSTESNKERLDRLKTLGVRSTLHKPFEPEDLCRLINEVMGVAS